MAVDEKSTYYDQGGYETIDIIKAKLTPEQFKGYLLGNLIKYSCRLNWKGMPERDAEKIDVYSGMLKEFLSVESEEDSKNRTCSIYRGYDTHTPECPNNKERIPNNSGQMCPYCGAGENELHKIDCVGFE